jgi:YqaJ-like viral recombinase domain
MKWDPNIAHGTDEWRAIRAGRLTSSKMEKFFNASYEIAMARDKSGLSQGAVSYMNGRIGERISGKEERGGFDNSSVRWGREQEPIALALLENGSSAAIFYDEWQASTPDYLIYDMDPEEIEAVPIQTVELKCPEKQGESVALRKAMRSIGRFKKEYVDHYIQAQHQIFCAMQVFPTIQSALFVTFDPDMPTQIVTLTLPPDEGLFDKFRTIISHFKAYVNVSI